MISEVVFDSSITAAWLLPDEKTDAHEALLVDVLDERVVLVEPMLWYYESTNLLRTAVIRGRLTDQSAKKALHAFQKIPVELVSPSKEGLADILSASLRYSVSVYDASYLRLAEERGIDLISADTDLLNLRTQFPWIKPIEEWRAQS